MSKGPSILKRLLKPSILSISNKVFSLTLTYFILCEDFMILLPPLSPLKFNNCSLYVIEYMTGFPLLFLYFGITIQSVSSLKTFIVFLYSFYL